jgi:hypothetical protein
MSNDYPTAIKNGSNYVRIGSKIFGDREIKWIMRMILLILEN